MSPLLTQILGCAPFERASDPDVTLSDGLSATFTRQGVLLRAGEDALLLSGGEHGRAGRWLSPTASPPEHTADRWSYARSGGLTEWWEQDGARLRQGWTLAERPAGTGPLYLEVRTDGSVLGIDEDGALLRSSGGGLWRYDDLRAWDADGEVLSAWMVPAAGRLWVAVEDTGRYPITVDPLAYPVEDKLLASDGAANDMFGVVARAGDVDGDGYDDIIVGAPSGAAYVYRGSSSGIDASSEVKLTPADGTTGAGFGYATACAGDINDDGYDDVIVGAWYQDSAAGAAYVYYGSVTGIEPASEDVLTASDGRSYSYFGIDVDGAGDVNRDGYDDVIIGARGGSSVFGAAYVYYGTASGIDASSEDKLTASDQDNSDRYGHQVAGAGDLDGDGYGDVLVGTPEDDDEGSAAGAVYVYYGSSSGIDASSEDKLTASDGAASDQYGIAVARAGDVDGDGYGDILIGAYLEDEGGSSAGAAYVYYGSSVGVKASSEDKLVASDAGSGDYFGAFLSAAGDLDGDGYGDILVSANQDDDAASNAGAVYVYYGSSAGIRASSEEKLTASDAAASDHYGTFVAGDLDIDGDGYPDAVVGAEGVDDLGTSSGAAYVITGDVDGDGDGVPSLIDCDDDDLAVRGPSTRYADSDGDGYGDPSASASVCPSASGYVTNLLDCDDTDAAISPSADELCDGVDNDCDRTVDEDDATDALTWYADEDGDGAGDPDSTHRACSQPPGFVSAGDDCDDTDADISPAAADVCGDGVDSDCDGIGDPDDDEDGDGLSHEVELGLGGSDCALDSDGDGVSDGDEVLAGTDISDTDSDDDGLTDGEERSLGSNPLSADSDSDGILDGDEAAVGTSLIDDDSDDDGLSDGEEVSLGTDPTDADSDNDGLSDGEEVSLGTDPLDSDADNDGLSDGAEVSLGTDPLDSDSDDDGLSDGEEVSLGTDPTDADSDNDTLSDGEEVAQGTDPLSADTDNDGLSDGVEITRGTDPNDPDSDNDGLLDGDEIELGTDPMDADSDNDGIRDGVDPDPVIPAQDDKASTCATASPGGSLVLLLAGLLGAAQRRRRQSPNSVSSVSSSDPRD